MPDFGRINHHLIPESTHQVVTVTSGLSSPAKFVKACKIREKHHPAIRPMKAQSVYLAMNNCSHGSKSKMKLMRSKFGM
ncbi:hypothetical protein PGTUg99_020242 [Puccinia graminis f. sp. tritici]|uniref:Uncharacterized protein n=1 Tax=Puccinia graminis f. sp. tritici TaxID=56615 RepID=A0A5B0M5H9_PUCGR|nr:hypothetical protein PGTUg99_020242 [Puccinia graminis f. sp. tritici]